MSSTEYLADSYGFTCSNKKFIIVYISLLVFGIIMEFFTRGAKASVSDLECSHNVFNLHYAYNLKIEHVTLLKSKIMHNCFVVYDILISVNHDFG